MYSGSEPTASLAPGSRELRARLLQEQAGGPTLWVSLDDRRTCLRCRRTFCGHDVRIEQGIFSQPPEYDLLCPTPDCRSGPMEWTALDERASSYARAVGTEERGFYPREAWLWPRYGRAKTEDDLRLVLWDQKVRANPLWARPNPALVARLVARCERELCWVIYTGGPDEVDGGFWHPKDPERPETLTQAVIPRIRPVVRVEGVCRNARRRLPEFFIVTAEIYYRRVKRVAGEPADWRPPPPNRFESRMRSREAIQALQRGIDEAMTEHLFASTKQAAAKDFAFTWFTQERTVAGWQPLGGTVE